MKKDGFVKGILVGIIITLFTMMFMGFGNDPVGHSRFRPMYVKVVE